MRRRYHITVIFVVFLLFIGISAEAAISVSAVSDFDVPGAPARIAIYPSGKIYVSDTQEHRVEIYSNNGILLNSIKGIGHPVALDVDASGNVYVGDADSGSIMVFDSGGSFLAKLGTGDGEFIIPSSLVVTSAGDVYVADPEARMVKAFTSGGNFSFGSGTFIKPTGITVDETVSPAELYIIDDDDGTGSAFGNRYVRVYSLAGSLLRSISLGGAFGGSTVTRPTGLRVDSTRLYITDGYESTVTVLSKTGALETRLGTLGTGFGELDVPTDMEFDSVGTLFVADYNNSRVNIYGVLKDTVASSTLVVSPSEISFTVTNRDTIPSQSVTIGSFVDGLGWTAVSTDPWLEVSAASGTTPSALNVSANATGLSSGTYSGQVQITTSDNILHVITVHLTVDLHIELSVTPLSLSFEYQAGAAAHGSAYPEQTLLIYSSSESVSWQATSNVDWVTLSSYLGTTPASVTVSINGQVDELPVEGFASFSGMINITAGNIPGSPADVNLYLGIHEAGNILVSTNLESASFELTGPQTLIGNGTSWTFQDLTPGDYTVTFSHIDGYIRPPAQTVTVESGETVEVTGTYRTVVADNGVVAVTGQSGAHTADIVDFAGNHVGSIDFLNGIESKTVILDFSAGDIDGNGFSEVAFTDGQNRVEIYNGANALVGELNFSGASEIRLTFADMDYDGKDELIAGVRSGSRMDIGIYGINSSGDLMRENMYPDVKEGGNFAIAAGDVDGDGLNELIVADAKDIRVYKPGSDSPLGLIWELTGLSSGMPSASTADLDGDGTVEVVVGYAFSKPANSKVYIIAGDGSVVSTFEAFSDLGYTEGTYVAASDTDGDFKDEMIVGAGPSVNNPSVVRFFKGAGTYTGITLDVLGLTSYGARIKAGRF